MASITYVILLRVYPKITWYWARHSISSTDGDLQTRATSKATSSSFNAATLDHSTWHRLGRLQKTLGRSPKLEVRNTWNLCEGLLLHEVIGRTIQ